MIEQIRTNLEQITVLCLPNTIKCDPSCELCNRFLIPATITLQKEREFFLRSLEQITEELWIPAGGCHAPTSNEACSSEARAVGSATPRHRVGDVRSSSLGRSQHHHSQTSFPPEILKADSERTREGVARLVTKSYPKNPTNVQGLQVHRRLGFLLQGTITPSHSKPVGNSHPSQI